MKRVINPPDLFDSLQYGFSQIVVSRGETTIHLSGQTAWDENEQIVGPGDLAIQTRAALKNIERALAHADATLRDIVTMRIYFVDHAREDLDTISSALRDQFPQEPPATTWIGVVSLADPAFLIEIEAIAVKSRGPD